MKKLIWCLSLILILGLIGCAGEKSEGDSFVGKWKLERTDDADMVLELTAANEWKFYRDGEMVEEGTFTVEGTTFTMKHAHGHDGGSAHAHDHVYEFSLSSDNKQMKLMSGDRTSVYNKL